MNNSQKKTQASSATLAPNKDPTLENVRKIAQLEEAAHRERSLGERVADQFSAFIGSWTFIIGQSVLLAGWIVLNVIAWMRHWDPYPFTFLNLALSFQAAYASPIIMMSQNRQARLSERRNHLDLQINILSEQENTQMLLLLRKISERLEIDCSDIPGLAVLEKDVEPTILIQQIEKAVEGETKKEQ
jgi:uncharacterized membrane protein